MELKMHLTNRREFLQGSLAVAAAAALPANMWAADGKTEGKADGKTESKAEVKAEGKVEVRRASDVIELGPAKIKVSRMAVGTGTLGAGYSSNQLRKLGAQGVADMLVHAYENGVFFWDTSDGYGTHAAIKLALQKVPREKVTIVTKTPDNDSRNLKADLDRYFRELGTDYIDIVLLHSRTRGDWDTLDKAMMDVLSEAKEKKIVRSVGISVHSLAAMRTAAKCAWLDVAMTRFNPGGSRARMDAEPAQVLPVLEEVKAAGKGIIGIKVLGEGLMPQRNRLDEALTFALNNNPAHCFSIGCESIADFKDNVSRIERLSKENPLETPKEAPKESRKEPVGIGA
jgi:1-deoxyxylulose-5-phosphate synthase